MAKLDDEISSEAVCLRDRQTAISSAAVWVALLSPRSLAIGLSPDGVAGLTGASKDTKTSVTTSSPFGGFASAVVVAIAAINEQRPPKSKRAQAGASWYKPDGKIECYRIVLDINTSR
jgi:hypothetical protein